MLLLWSQYSFIQSSTAADYTIYPYYDYTTNPSQPIYTGSFIQFDAFNIITRDGQIVPLIVDDKNILSNLTDVAKKNDKIAVLIGNSANNNFITFRYYNDERSPAIAAYMIPAPKNKDYIAYIQWHAKTTNGFAAGAINIYDKASIAGNTSFTIQMGGQSLIKTLSSTLKGYQVYDIYMAVAPNTMTIDASNIDISARDKGYSYKAPLDGPLFMFQSTSCKDVNSNNGCTNCSIATKFAIDGVSIALSSLPTNNAWLAPVIVRIHVGQASSVAPDLPSTISNMPTMNSATSTINLNGTKLYSIELSTDNQTWTSIPLNTTANYNEYKCFHTKGNYYYNLDEGNGIHWFDTASAVDSAKPVFVRINNMFVLENVISSIPLDSGEHTFFVNP